MARSAQVGSNSRPSTYVALVRAFLDDVPSHHVEVRELARLAGVSSGQIAHAFKAVVGVPPMAYLARVRVERAADLIRSGMRPAVAAADVGFHDQSHLHRHFKRTTGLTPAQYADLHRQDAKTGLTHRPA